MNEPVTPSPDPDRGLGYESTDVNVWYVLAFGLGLALMVIAVLPLMGSMFAELEKGAKRQDVPRSPLARAQEPPAPRLEPQPSASLAKLRRQEDEVLTQYRWIDKQQGVAQIPVDRAMQLLVERGLPEPKPVQESPEGGETRGSTNEKTPAERRRAPQGEGLR